MKTVACFASLLVLVSLAGCATTDTTDVSPPMRRAEPGQKSVGSNLRKKPVQPAVKVSGDEFKSQSDLVRSDPTGEQILNGRN